MRYIALIVAAAFAVLPAVGTAGDVQALKIPMHALNGSNENGTAVLTQVSGGVRVTVELENAPDQAQPTHIHIGTCAAINKAPEYALESTVKGRSTTVVRGVSLKDLLSQHYAVNVHKSADDLGTYASCGDIQ